MDSVKLITITPNIEKTIAYIARVSSPNQENPEYAKLLAYCIKHRHWSVFEHGFLSMEIKTSRAISAQILRHRSFTFSEFSQRYAAIQSFEYVEARSQDTKNRQNSLENVSDKDIAWFEKAQYRIQKQGQKTYDEALKRGIAKECARFILPMNVSSTIYMTGNVRSWIHYIELRTGNGTQKEHRLLAEEAKQIFIRELPIVAKALDWNNGT